MMKQIVVATREPARVNRLLAVLAEWLQIDIIIKDFGVDSQGAAQVVFCRTGDDFQFAFSVATDRLILFSGEEDNNEKSPVIFSDSQYLLPALRGQQLQQCVRGGLPATCEGEVLATAGGSLVWTTTFHPQGHGTEFAMEALPQLQPHELLFDQLQSSQWTGLLPLIAFRRRITQDQGWVSPPLRACFMFDDPNLHWPTYGFLDYAVLARHAKRYDYHVAIATIPLDAWFVHSAVARLFRENTSHLSLLVHGNNHTRNELGRSYGDGTREGLVAQSLKRIARLERVSNLRVSRVMAAPHSACTADVAAQLLHQGFEAVCISHELLRRFNPTTEWSPLFGLEPAEFLSDGLPVIPRFHLSPPRQRDGLKDRKKCTNPIIIAALTGQAIIPFGHHEDLADELNLLAETRENISRMGTEVQWCNLTRIARTNYKHRISGTTLQLKMYSRYIEVPIPAEIETVEVHRPWHRPEQAGESLQMRINKASWTETDGGKIPFPQQKGEARLLEIRSVALGSVDYRQIESQPLRPWAIMRRLLTEARDRCHLRGK
jgi:hypothetical protein